MYNSLHRNQMEYSNRIFEDINAASEIFTDMQLFEWYRDMTLLSNIFTDEYTDNALSNMKKAIANKLRITENHDFKTQTLRHSQFSNIINNHVENLSNLINNDMDKYGEPLVRLVTVQDLVFILPNDDLTRILNSGGNCNMPKLKHMITIYTYMAITKLPHINKDNCARAVQFLNMPPLDALHILK